MIREALEAALEALMTSCPARYQEAIDAHNRAIELIKEALMELKEETLQTSQ